MVCVHMLDDAGLSGEEIAGTPRGNQELGRLKIDDAAEAADIVSALHL